MNDFHNFSSLPPHEEQTFIVYEQRMAEATKKGLTLGAIAGVIVLIVAIGIYKGVDPEEIDLSKDMNMSNLTKKEASAAPTPAPAPAPPPTTPAPTTTPPEGSGAAPAAGSATAPAPAGGAAAPAPAAGSAAPAEAPAPK
jgi:hypothetical protein